MIFFKKKFLKTNFAIFIFLMFFSMINLEAEEKKETSNIIENNQKIETNQQKLYSNRIKRFQFSDSISGIFFKRKTEIVDLAIILEEMGDLFEKTFLKENGFENGVLISDHLISLIEMGSENDPLPEDFREKLNDYGIQFSINQTQDDLILRIRCLKKYLPEAFSLIFNAFLFPNFSADNLKISKNSVNSVAKSFYQNNDLLAKTYFFQNIFKGTIYEEYFPKISRENLITTEILKKYHSEILSAPKKIKIAVVGDFNGNSEILDQKFKDFLSKVSVFSKSENPGLLDPVKNFFKNLKDSNESKAQIINPILNNEKIIYIKEGEKNPQTIIRFAHQGLKISDPNYIKFSLLMDALGGRGLESLLMKKIREEKGFTYGIYFSPVSFRFSNFISGVMATNSSNNKEEIISEILDVIKKFSENGITEENLASLKRKAKNNISSYFKNNESVLSSMMFLEQNSLNEKYFDELKEKIDSISLESINQFAKEFFDVNKIKFVVY